MSWCPSSHPEEDSKDVARVDKLGSQLRGQQPLSGARHSQWILQLLVRVDKNFNLQTINLNSQPASGSSRNGMARNAVEWSGVELKAPNKWSKHSLLKNKNLFCIFA